jgi:predicted nucleotidyltransferase
MNAELRARLRDFAAAWAAAHPGLHLLVLHGSRARGDAHGLSDWDFAASGTPDLDLAGLAAALGTAVRHDEVDLVDLGRASGLLRARVAGEGVPIYERARGAFVTFATEATLFWLDIEPLVRVEHEALLGRLAR